MSLTTVNGLLSTVYFINYVIIFMDCNGIILIEKRAQFGEFARGVWTCDPGFICGGDFDDEARTCNLQVIHKICTQGSDVWMGNMVIKIKVKNVGRGNMRAGFEHGKQCAACPVQRLDGVTRFEIFFEEVCNLHGAVGGCGDGFIFYLADEGLGRGKESKEKDEG